MSSPKRRRAPNERSGAQVTHQGTSPKLTSPASDQGASSSPTGNVKKKKKQQQQADGLSTLAKAAATGVPSSPSNNQRKRGRGPDDSQSFSRSPASQRMMKSPRVDTSITPVASSSPKAASDSPSGSSPDSSEDDEQYPSPATVNSNTKGTSSSAATTGRDGRSSGNPPWRPAGAPTKKPRDKGEVDRWRRLSAALIKPGWRDPPRHDSDWTRPQLKHVDAELAARFPGIKLSLLKSWDQKTKYLCNPTAPPDAASPGPVVVDLQDAGKPQVRWCDTFFYFMVNAIVLHKEQFIRRHDNTERAVIDLKTNKNRIFFETIATVFLEGPDALTGNHSNDPSFDFLENAVPCAFGENRMLSAIADSLQNKWGLLRKALDTGYANFKLSGQGDDGGRPDPSDLTGDDGTSSERGSERGHGAEDSSSAVRSSRPEDFFVQKHVLYLYLCAEKHGFIASARSAMDSRDQHDGTATSNTVAVGRRKPKGDAAMLAAFNLPMKLDLSDDARAIERTNRLIAEAELEEKLEERKERKRKAPTAAVEEVQAAQAKLKQAEEDGNGPLAVIAAKALDLALESAAPVLNLSVGEMRDLFARPTLAT